MLDNYVCHNSNRENFKWLNSQQCARFYFKKLVGKLQYKYVANIYEYSGVPNLLVVQIKETKLIDNKDAYSEVPRQVDKESVFADIDSPNKISEKSKYEKEDLQLQVS